MTAGTSAYNWKPKSDARIQRREAFELSGSSSHVSSRSICRSEVRSNLFDVVEESGGARTSHKGKDVDVSLTIL